MQVCQFLYDNLGLDYFIKQDKEGKAALDYAELYSRDAVADWLRGVK